MFVLDTNVVSELRKIHLGRADENVARWADGVETAALYLSAITVQELEVGVLLAERRDPSQGAVFRTWFEDRVLPAFTGRILPVDTAVRTSGHPTYRLSIPGITTAARRGSGHKLLNKVSQQLNLDLAVERF